MDMLPEINNDLKDGYNPNLSERNQNAQVMSGGSEVVQRLLENNTRNYTGTSAEEVMEMFQTYGVRKHLNLGQDDWSDLL
jgi:hypothetical protein